MIEDDLPQIPLLLIAQRHHLLHTLFHAIPQDTKQLIATMLDQGIVELAINVIDVGQAVLLGRACHFITDRIELAYGRLSMPGRDDLTNCVAFPACCAR